MKLVLTFLLSVALALSLAACGGRAVSEPVASVNVAPVAQAGDAQAVTTGSTVTLDGRASSDANGDALGYRWTLSAKPAGSAATLASALTATPSFVADLAGDYQVSLTVNDGQLDSDPATVSVRASAANIAPVANAGTAQFLATGGTATLDASASSDANGDALSYLWTLSAKPAGSLAVLSSTTAAKPVFVADLAGAYRATLTVSDGKLGSAAATVTVNAVAPRAANVAFLAGNGMTVTLSSFTSTPLGDGRVRHTATFSQENKTGAAIDLIGMRLFFTDALASGDSTSLGQLAPGQTSNTVSFFVAPGRATPLLLQYDAGPISDLPLAGALQWMLPLP